MPNSAAASFFKKKKKSKKKKSKKSLAFKAKTAQDIAEKQVADNSQVVQSNLASSISALNGGDGWRDESAMAKREIEQLGGDTVADLSELQKAEQEDQEADEKFDAEQAKQEFWNNRSQTKKKIKKMRKDEEHEMTRDISTLSWREKMEIKKSRSVKLNLSNERAFPTLGGTGMPTAEAKTQPVQSENCWGVLGDDDEEEEEEEQKEEEKVDVEYGTDDFIAAPKFQGSKEGYDFMQDKFGLGYYRTIPTGKSTNKENTASAATNSEAAPAVPQTEEELLASAKADTSRFGKKKKKKKKKKAAPAAAEDAGAEGATKEADAAPKTEEELLESATANTSRFGKKKKKKKKKKPAADAAAAAPPVPPS